MTVEETKKRQRHFDRVTLDAATLAKLDSWIGQVEAVKHGVHLCRKEILNWLVMNLPERLSPAQERGLADEFYSELRYLQFAEREIRAAEAKGERLSLKELEARRAHAQVMPTRKSRKTKSSDTSSSEPPQTTVAAFNDGPPD
jgi:hypothetical protein